ncbi:uncharacterized protein LOC143921494 [Arctopsyche grandis]|uniref:uncharacterized protein LOC143921494 n=1 Tax=Arctopsyche grandis TaxID=121162 RepID=UPI00406DA399
MEFIQCRLCLSSGLAESFVSIHDNLHPHLAKRISSCCQLQVEASDGLPDAICRSCNNNLELLIDFRKICLRSDGISKLKLNKRVDIKQEEVLLEDLIWEKELSRPNVCNAPAKAKKDSKQSIRSTGIVNSPICKRKRTLCNHNSNKKLTLFKCDICLQSFNRKADLRTHKKIHTEEKSYKCDICLKSFVQKSNFTKHNKIHTGLKAYKCDTCLKSFVQKGCLIRHIKSHTGLKPYKCDICLKTFTRKNYLVNHERRHAGEKPPKCDICSKLFFNKYSLTIHMRCHTGEKPYQCDICYKSFILNANLVMHKKTHTEKLPHQCRVAKTVILTETPA